MNAICTPLNRARFERATTFIVCGGVFGATVEEDRQPDGALGADAALCLSDNCYYGYDVVTPVNICRYLAFWSAKRGEGCVVTTHESEDALLGVVQNAEREGGDDVYFAAFDLDGPDGVTLTEISLDIEHIVAVHVIDRFPATATEATNLEGAGV